MTTDTDRQNVPAEHPVQIGERVNVLRVQPSRPTSNYHIAY